MRSEKKGTRFSTIISFFTAGAALGILFAPDTGRNTRRKIRDEFDDMKDNLEETWTEQSEKVRDRAEDIGERAQQKARDISNRVEEKTHSQ